MTAFIFAVVLASCLGLLSGCAPATVGKSCQARAATHLAAQQLANTTAGPCPWAAQEGADELPAAPEGEPEASE